ncbi:MAG: hypothetical protein WC783_02595 [Candidatus Paceibacterota bacterium]|jgi:hypothetical protein
MEKKYEWRRVNADFGKTFLMRDSLVKTKETLELLKKSLEQVRDEIVKQLPKEDKKD